MRWISYFIFAYLALGFQMGISRAMETHNAGPNLVLLAVVFIAMNAPREGALLGAFILGTMQDLGTAGTMGLYAFSYGIVALFVLSARQVINREHLLTYFTVTLTGGCLTAFVLAIHGWLRPPGMPMLSMFFTALYTAVLAPPVLWIMQRMRRVFRFQPWRQVKLPSVSR